MTVIEFAEHRLTDPNNEYHCQAYWSAYLDGARAQKKEDETELRVHQEYVRQCNVRIRQLKGRLKKRSDAE